MLSWLTVRSYADGDVEGWSFCPAKVHEVPDTDADADADANCDRCVYVI
jgi:hypothetical protein